jgi:hypothetical protein
MSDYPNAIFAPRTTENKSGVVYTPSKTTVGYAEDYSLPADEMVAVQTELGTNASGAYATVKAWLTALAAAIANVYTKDEVDSLVGGANFAFFFTDTASDLGSTFIADPAFPSVAESTLTSASYGIVDDQLLFRFATDAGQPTFPTIRAGAIELHGHYERTIGGKNVNLYGVLKERKVDTSEVIIATTEISGEVTSKGDVTMHAILSDDYEFDSSDSRLILEVYANITGGGGNVTIASYQEGDTTAAFSVVTNISALDSKYFGKTASGEISALTEKTLTVHGDEVMIEDSEDSFSKKKVSIQNIKKTHIVSVSSSATPTPDADITDQYIVSNLAVGATFGAPSGTPLDGQVLKIRIKDNGTTRTLGFNAIYRAVGVTLPTDTTASKTIYLGIIYNLGATKWDVVAVAEEA